MNYFLVWNDWDGVNTETFASEELLRRRRAELPIGDYGTYVVLAVCGRELEDGLAQPQPDPGEPAPGDADVRV